MADPGLQKINAYIECYNGVEQPIHEGFQTYTAWINDPEAGPTGKEAQPRSPGKVLSHRVEYCGQPLTDALARMPATPLDEPVRQYQTAFQSLYALIERADGYFTREDYRRDNGEGMRAQHAPLMQAYAAFFAAGTALDAALEKREDERRAAQLKEIEAAEGRSLARAIRVAGTVEPVFVEEIASLPQTIMDVARDGDVVLCMGAGSIGAVPGKVVEMAAQQKGTVA